MNYDEYDILDYVLFYYIIWRFCADQILIPRSWIKKPNIYWIYVLKIHSQSVYVITLPWICAASQTTTTQNTKRQRRASRHIVNKGRDNIQHTAPPRRVFIPKKIINQYFISMFININFMRTDRQMYCV